MTKKVKSKRSLLVNILLWSPKNKIRLPRYSMLFVAVLSFIWVITISYIKLSSPKYISKWTLVLPGKGAGSNVNLIDIGNTSTSAASPYSNSVTDPKANYKAFATSQSVIESAAEHVSLTLREFGKPRIKLIDQTSLLYLSIEGSSPEEAQNKAYALHNSLMSLLDKLREDELQQQEGSALEVLEKFRGKLNSASKKLLDFQSQSNIVSMAQFNELVLSIEQLRRDRTHTKAQLKEVAGKTSQLEQILGFDAKLASNALILQNDIFFQEIISDHAKNSLALTQVSNRWGEKHPDVVNAKASYFATKKSLSTRLNKLLPTHQLKNELLLTLQSDSTRNKLMQDLIEFDTNKIGLQQKIKELTILINALINERNELTIPASRLDELIRNHQVAEAIFTSALARTDTSKSDVFVSYPLVQILDKPDVPEKPSSPNKLFALLGATASSIFVTIGLILLWVRKPYIQKILKKI